MTSKPCTLDGLHTCRDYDCWDPWTATCDRHGCDYNPFRVGNTDFFGRGKTVDTNEPFTYVPCPRRRTITTVANDGRVVTRFTEEAVTQFFIQDGVKIEAPAPVLDGFESIETGGISGEYCDVKAWEFQERDTFIELGGITRQNQILRQPLVLAMSIKDDVSSSLNRPKSPILHLVMVVLTTSSTLPGTSGSTPCIRPRWRASLAL